MTVAVLATGAALAGTWTAAGNSTTGTLTTAARWRLVIARRRQERGGRPPNALVDAVTRNNAMPRTPLTPKGTPSHTTPANSI
ncbi:hypothetical protein GCM10023170_090450 [Phytohabitans houttuyneae]|uniref:Secreted protein n=1 Tax=Phytohabitans houttuyneae TaxID=1076126 RepID=A0A6V8KA13_9ACTN|nr:hypothetical protein Phou_062420 [Phytohabitans houttuyneae]